VIAVARQQHQGRVDHVAPARRGQQLAGRTANASSSGRTSMPSSAFASRV
jgi:hypothetical protein